jgi:L-fucose mutarotase
MLKGLSPLLHPTLLSFLAEMGHGDEIAIVDRNYPAFSTAQRLCRVDGASATETLEAILSLLPLDDFVPSPAFVMAPSSGEPPPVLAAFQSVVDSAEGRHVNITPLERFAFYERARRAYAVVATSEGRLYGNIIVTKGIIR